VVARKAKADSIKAAQATAAAEKKTKDSLALVAKKAKADSAKAAAAQTAAHAALAKKAADSTAAARKAARADSLKAAQASAAAAKKTKDSLAAVTRAARADSIKASQAAAVAAKKSKDSLAVLAKKARADSIKTAQAEAVAAKKTKDSLALAARKARADSIKAAQALALAVKRANDSALAAQKKARADSIKAAASRPKPPRIDSVSAKRYRIMIRPLNKEQIRYFLVELGMKDASKPESTAVNWIYRDKNGSTLIYEPENSDVAFANDAVPMLGEKDFIADSLIHTRTDGLLKGLLKEKAERYVFANYEITQVQKKAGEGKDAKVLPPVPAFYTGRYVRKLDERIVLGDAFQIRLGYGEGGAIQAFSYRDPVIAEVGTAKAPTKEYVQDSLVRWTKSKTRPQRILYPFHPDKLRVKDIKPIKTFDSYVITQEKNRENPQLDGAYLTPAVTVLAEVTLAPSEKKLTEAAPAGPIILHFQFPCRPETGLCWPDGKQEMLGTPPPPAAHQLPPTRATGAANPAKGAAPATAPKAEAQPAPAQAPAKAPAPEKPAAPAPK
jgi:chemotaxis protein histidine kinase CheA